jgi:hypothetical protein
MLVWSTQFPVLPNYSGDDLLRLCRRWLGGSPHASSVAEIPETKEDDVVKATKGAHQVEVAKITRDDGVYVGFRHQWQDGEKQEWVTEVCGWNCAQRFLIGIHVHCQTAKTGEALPRCRKPYIVKLLLEEFGGDVDGPFEVSASPKALQESEVDVACRLLRGEMDLCLPVIYASVTWKNQPYFSPYELAKWAAGMAHVVLEPSRRFSFILGDRINRLNPYEGAVAICWPRGSGRITRVSPYLFPKPVRFASAVADQVQRALAGRRPDYHCTWDHLRELIFRRKIDTLKKAGEASVDEFVGAFDQEMRATKNRLEEAEREIGRLKGELAWRTRDEKISADGLIALGPERDLFGGEQRDIIIDALQNALLRVQPNGRVSEVLQSLIDANRPSKEGERIEGCIREALQNCENLGKQERRQLEEIGFSITEDGKHLKLVFRGDDRYTFAMSKTGSDHRGMKNWISDTTKRLFK